MNSLLRTRYSLTFILNTLILVLFATGIYANNSGSVISANSDEETADMNAICPPPTITAQPQSITTCEGSDVTFAVTANSNGTGSITYQWKKNGSIISGATRSNYTITGITDANAATYEGSYVVVVTKSCGAVVTSLQVTLNVNTVSAGSISGAQTICPGADPAPLLSTINGTGEGSVSYQWEESRDNSTWSAIAGATSQDYDPDILYESRYYRRATSSLLNGVTCQEYSNVVSIIVEQVSVLISSNSPLCEGSTLELTASGGASYSWSGPNSFISTSQNPSLANIPLEASGTYEVTATSILGCSTVVSTTVTINPLPTPTATNNSPVCEGASLSLSSCGGTLFSWTGPLAFTSSDKHPAISEASMDHAGEYSVVVTNDYGCSAVATTVVVVNPRPSPTADNNGPTCEGGSVNLSASGGDAYLWSGPSDFSSTDQNPSLVNATVSANGTYVVIVTNANGCSAQATTTVLISAPPTISISSMDSINIGGLLRLNADGGVTYSWTGPNGFTSTEQNPSISNATLGASGTYTVTVTSADGCMALATVRVVVFSVAPNEASSNSPADEGGNIYLQSGEGESYYWEGPNGFTSNDQNPVIDNADASYSGTYTVTVTDQYGNSYTSTTEVVIYPTPSASSNGVTCEGSIINLSASGGDSYAWTGPNGFTSSDQNPIITSAQLGSAGIYTVTVTRSDGSTRTASTTLSVYPSYSVSLPAAISCDAYTLPWGQEATTSGNYSHLYTSINGCDSLVSISVTIHSSYQTLAAAVSDCGNHTLPWGTEVTSSGSYSHTYVSSNGCDSIVTVNVNIHPKYDVQGNAVMACDNYTLPWGELVTATGDYSYTYPSVNACDSTIHVHVTINPSYQVTDASVTACDTYQLPWGETASTPGTYTHIYTSAGGCDSTVSIKVDLNKSYSVVAEPVTACNSHTLPWGQEVTASGNYSHTYTTASGCDSTVSVSVAVNHSYNITGNPVSACTSYTLPWGEVATVTDDYDYTYSATTGCDSTVTFHVTINPVYNISASAVESCNSYTLPWGAVATSTGDYNHTYASLGGCDSTVTLHVTINHDAATSLDAVSCDNYTLPWGATVAASGDYSYTYATVNGCDSVVTAHVTINHAAVSSISATACDNYTLPWGATVAASGDYSHTYATVNGCDSVVTANVVINNSKVSTFSATACNSYTLPWGESVFASGNYSHTYQTASGCDSVVTGTITINSSPSASASSSSPVCEGSTTSLLASGGNSYSWTGPNGYSSTEQNPLLTNVTALAAGTYTVTVTDAVGCTASATASLAVNSIPVVVVSNNGPICPGGSSNCSGFRTQTQGGWGASPNGNNPAVYLQANFANAFPDGLTIGCGSNTLKLTSAAAIQDFLPSGSTGSVLPAGAMVDPGSSYSNVFAAQLVAATLNVVFDQYDSTFSSNSVFSKNLIRNSGTFAGWTVEQLLTEANNVIGGCASSFSITDLNEALDAFNNNFVDGSQNLGNFVCQQLSPLQLSASSNNATDTYSWTGPNGFTSALQTPGISNVTSAAAGNYTVTVTNAAGCSATASTEVVVNSLPTATAFGDSVCVGSTINLSASGGTSYSWYGPNGFTSTSQNPTIPNATTAHNGTYSVTVGNGTGCTSTLTVKATVTAYPVVTVSGGSVCVGGTLNLSSSGGSNYSWTGPDGFASTLQNPAITNVTAAAAGTYTVTVTNGDECSASASITVGTNTPPVVTASAGTVCEGNTLNLSATGGGSYAWVGPNGFTSAAQYPCITNVTTAAAGTYTVTVTNAAGCTAVATATATVTSNTLPTITGTNSICSGANTTFDAGSGYGSYLWSNGATTQTISIGTAGTYTVTVTNANGCTATASRTLTVTNLPAAPLVSVMNNCNGTSTLTASGFTGSLNWSNGASVNPNIVSAAGSYTVTQTINGCTSPASSAATASPKTSPSAPVLSVIDNCGGTSTLTASGYTGTLTWSSGGSGNPKSVTTAGTYSVTQTVNGCVSPASNTVSAAPKQDPTCSITTPTSCVLGGAEYTFTAPSGMDTYAWSVSGCGASIVGSSTGATVTIKASNTTGSYTVSLTLTDNGCTSTCTKSMNVKRSKKVSQYCGLYTTGPGVRPTITKSALTANFKVYDLNTCGSPNGRQDNYSNIWNSTNGLVEGCTVSSPELVNYGGGKCYRYTITVPEDQKCLILGQSTVPSSYYSGGSCNIYSGNKVNDGDDDVDPSTGNARKFNCVIKDYNGKYSEGLAQIHYGSELLIITPAALEFTDSTENLPVVYESAEGLWSSEVSPTPPEGFYAIPDTALTIEVTDSTMDAVQFTIVDTGSVWSYTELLHKIRHKGTERLAYTNPIMINKRTPTLKEILLYPNPATGNVVIDLPQFEGRARVYVHSMHGQLMIEKKAKIVDAIAIDVSALPAGMYLVSVENDEGRVSSKLIKESE